MNFTQGRPLLIKFQARGLTSTLISESNFMASKKQRMVGWVLCGLVAAMLIGPSAMGKFMEWEGKEEAFAKMGFTTDLMFKIGVLEVVLALLLLIPRTSFLGAILLTGYLGGATVTHLRVADSFAFPIILGIVMWVGCGLRQPSIFGAAQGK